MRRTSRGFTLIELLIVVAIIGIIAAVAIPNLLNAIDKGKQKRTMSDIRTIGSAIEAYSVDNSYYPTAASLAAVQAILEPLFVRTMPMADGWSNPLQADSTPTSYTILSPGKDGSGSSCVEGVTSSFNDEICFANGQLRRYPEGTQQ